MSRLAGSTRAALLDTLAAGVSGTYQALAEAAGVQPEAARATLKELSRCKQVRALERQRTDGRAGASRVVYGAHQDPFDSLGFALQVWR